MKGKYHIVIQNNKLRYELDIRRNITIIRGDSATGKTKLIQLLEQAAALGEWMSFVSVRAGRWAERTGILFCPISMGRFSFWMRKTDS